ncbi:hypothetical protein LTR36_010468 [Oleoguttula mirabilis]|uniref:Ras-GAP domain-containing protein n=1 Tax=Oleoguttula mirabilis TaxID=1507867 RepID=A0AAV9J4S4_9PEZI|nr:hypothetical protein LTR36_010468 [Oleoguttula mirabilis]
MDGNGRQRWTQDRRRKEANLYDEWLKEEREAERQASQALATPSRHGSSDTTGGLRQSAGTIRAVTPEDAVNTEVRQEDSPLVPDRGTTSFEQAFIPLTSQRTLGTTTTIVGGPAAAPRIRTRRLGRDREWERDGRIGQSPPSSGNGVPGSGMLERSGSRSNGQHAHSVTPAREAHNAARPRTRTLEETGRRERSPPSLHKSRNRIGSVHTPSSHGADYLASVPAITSSPQAPSISSLGSPVRSPAELAPGRSISPMSSETANSLTSGLPPASAKRIVYLMRTLRGTMGGNVVFRRNESSPWSQIYCYVKVDTGSLMYEPRGGDGAHRTLVPDLRGCSVIPSVESDETPYLEVSLPNSESELHVKLLTQADFDAWFATFLWWRSPYARQGGMNGSHHPPTSAHAMSPTAPDPPPRTSSARQLRERAGTNKSDRRKSVMVSSLKEAPVIKIGKMIFWDTNVGYSSNSPSTPQGHSNAARPQAYRMQSYGSRRWRRISGQLRENGELKLHSDADNTLISVVQLSQLSRCAIQRLDSSVLENDFCIAIYPQYTSTLSNNSPGFLRPIFLSLENRVLYEVWFVLLRAFTIPQLYGPPTQAQNGLSDNPSTDTLHATTTNDMFRVERSLSMRIVEAKMYPPMGGTTSPDSGFSGGHSRGTQPHIRPEQNGYYAEVLLDKETRGKTAVKYEGLGPLWGESFDFVDLPAVLSSASVVIRRRPPDSAHAREQHESKLVHEAYGFTSDQHGGFSGLTFDVTCGKVEIYLSELEDEKEVEKWWPVMLSDQQVGEVLIKARGEEGVILTVEQYQPLSELLHRFSNGLTLQIAQLFPSDLKRLSDCLLNIYQVSGKAGDWLMALVEEEIDGIHKETPITRLRYSRRIGSNDSNDSLGTGGPNSDRELIVRDLGKNATVEANLLFRGNTLLTKSLDTHMRRVGKEYLEDSLAAKIREINDKDPNCEVDPNRVEHVSDLERNWRRLLLFTQEVWKAILAAKAKCPIELRIIFRHIRACAEDRYGDFLRSVSYSSVSGFLFLRFFCPAVLNPKLFGLLKEDIKPRARRAFILIAKSLQTLANMASFGTKETWMEPMNAFLTQHREGFKGFINDVCYVPTPLSNANYTNSAASSPTYQHGFVSAETHLSYTTPMTIMQRLPPTSREGFPSLPYLIDQAKAYADLVQLWLEITSHTAHSDMSATVTRRLSDVLHAIQASDGDLSAFHAICGNLSRRTQECLNRAERAERPTSALSFRWEELIDQLQSTSNTIESGDELPGEASFDRVTESIVSEASILPPGMNPRFGSSDTLPRRREWDPAADEGDGDTGAHATRLYGPPPAHSGAGTKFDVINARPREPIRDRPGSASIGSSLHGSLRRALQSRGSDNSASASASNVSSTVSSDTEHSTTTTALPSYEREVRHRERREAAKQQIQQQMEDAKVREREKERRKVKTPLAALRKRKEREGKSDGMGVRRGVDMSHV